MLTVTREIYEAYELENEFERMGRANYFSEDGYDWILENYDGELDVVAICCECCEYEVDDFVSDHEYIQTFREYLEDNDVLKEYAEEKGIEDYEDAFRNFSQFGLITTFTDEYDDYVADLIRSVRAETVILDNGNIIVRD